MASIANSVAGWGTIQGKVVEFFCPGNVIEIFKTGTLSQNGMLKHIKVCFVSNYGNMVLQKDQKIHDRRPTIEVFTIHTKVLRMSWKVFFRFHMNSDWLLSRGDNSHKLGYGMCHFLRVLFWLKNKFWGLFYSF